MTAFLINLVVLTVTTELADKEIARNNSALNDNTRIVFDGYFRNLETSAYNTLNSYSISSILANSNGRNEYVKAVMRDIFLQRAGLTLVSGITLVFNNDDLCITGDAMFDKQVAFDAFFSDYYSTKEAWLTDMFSVSYKEYKTVSGKSGKKVLFVYVSPTLDNTKPAAVIMELSPLLATVPDGLSELVIVDAQGHQILPFPADENVKFELPRDEGFLRIKLGNVQYAVNYIQSEVVPYKYVFMVRDDVYGRQVRTINLANVVSCTILLVAGLILSIYFTSKHYALVRPVVRELERIDGSADLARLTVAVDQLIND